MVYEVYVNQMMGGFLRSVGSFPYRLQSLQIAPILSPNFILVMIQFMAVWLLRSPVSTASQACSRKAGEFIQPLTARRRCWYFSQTFTFLNRSQVQQYSSSPFSIVQTKVVAPQPAFKKSSTASQQSLSSFASANSRPSLQKGLSGTEQVKLSRFDGLGAAKFLGVLKPLQLVQVGQKSQQRFQQSMLALSSRLYFTQSCSNVQDRSSMLKQSLTALKSYWLTLCSTFLGLLTSVLFRVLRRSNCTPGPLILPLSFESELQRDLSQRIGPEGVLALLLVMLSPRARVASRASRLSRRAVLFIQVFIVLGIDPLCIQLALSAQRPFLHN